MVTSSAYAAKKGAEMKKVIPLCLLFCVILSLLAGCSPRSGRGDAFAGNPYEKGVLTETGFISEYLNLKYTLPEGFIISTQADMDALMDINSDSFDAEGYAGLSTVYEMKASAEEGDSPSVLVKVEKLLISIITEAQYFESLQLQLLTIYEGAYSFDETITDVEIAGKNYKKLSAAFKSETSEEEFLRDYIIRKNNDRIISFVVTYSADAIEEMEAMMKGFSKN